MEVRLQHFGSESVTVIIQFLPFPTIETLCIMFMLKFALYNKFYCLTRVGVLEQFFKINFYLFTEVYNRPEGILMSTSHTYTWSEAARLEQLYSDIFFR